MKSFGDEITIDQLRLIGTGNEAFLISLDWQQYRSHDARLATVEKAVDHSIREIMKTAHLYQGRKEDELTDIIIKQLGGMGILATHDTQYGGHCDIVVETQDGFLWIAESKINNKGYDWILQGFQQLDTRYTTGIKGQDSGDIIVFLYNESMMDFMNEWVKRLSAARPDVSGSFSQNDPTQWVSSHKHARSGLPFRIRHLPVSLYFKPADKRAGS